MTVKRLAHTITIVIGLLCGCYAVAVMSGYAPRNYQYSDRAIWTGANLVIRITRTDDFQWTKIDTCIAVYPGYVVKYQGGVCQRLDNPPYHIDLVEEF